ncbi:hypothetical protein HOF56_01145 [Candidatus Peribacteria bacterium]|jgi:prolipoprotein diacylglyceryltransferase|nr:hypothetical protein [Candidatus Peribacteria bacterium]MBT4020923.1 hypothetical protein [Candidatus Peribacteria bacterium]MBT4240481.1 hypothetical protein [Candidatus Peribacteria bacterium]MBT4474365.1 hypothetical protein [Candidatus Peribacteria bacterium]
MFEIFQFGPLLLRSHILFLLIGIVLGADVFFRLANREGLRIILFLKNGWTFLISFLLGGRLLGMLLLYYAYTQDPMKVLIVWDGVFSITGGLVGIGLMLFIYTYRQRAQFLRWMDIYVPSATIIVAFDWIGRFMGAVSYGKPTDAFWGITMESIGVRYTVPIHPVQIYYAIWFLGLSFLLFHMRRRKQLNVLPARLYKILGAKASSVQIHTSRSGMVTLVGIVLSCIGVIFLDFYRGDFAITVFAKFIDFAFLALLFVSLGTISVMEKKISNKHSMLNSIMVGMATMVYLIIRPYISIISFEWRFSQFLSVLAVLVTIVYVVVHRWKYQNH